MIIDLIGVAITILIIKSLIEALEGKYTDKNKRD